MESIRYAASQSVSPHKSCVALIGEGRLTSNSESKVRSITLGLLPKNSSRMSLTESRSSSELSSSELSFSRLLAVWAKEISYR
jgi:hypothetical protein